MRHIDDTITIVREEERGFAAAVHLVNALPLWGFVFLIGIWIYFKERSREVVFHVQQALAFQTAFLGIGVFWLFFSVLFKIVGRLSPGIGGLLERANTFFLVLLFTAYACACIAACVMTYMGRPFLYPVVGRKVLDGGNPDGKTARG